MAVKQLYINGIGSGSFKVFINSDTYLNSPTLDYNEYTIPAVDGNIITYNKRLNNVVRRFDCFIKTNPIQNLESFKKLIYSNIGYVRIESDYDAETYQYGYLAEEIAVSPFNDARELKFSLYFSCKPQKWLKVNTPASGSELYDKAYISNIYQRNNDNIKNMLNLLPIDMQPTDEYYVQYTLDSSLASQTITNISATNSSNGLVIVCGTSVQGTIPNLTYTHYLVCYGNGTASAASYTLPLGTNTLKVIVPVKGVASVSATADTSGGTSSFVFDASSVSTSVANADAIGLSADFTFEYSFQGGGGGNVRYSPIVVQTKLGSEFQNEEIITIHFEKMDADTIQYIYDNYAESYKITVKIDADNNAKIVKGADNMDITSYVEVIGNIEGLCDSAIVVPYKSNSNTGSINKIASINPRWWKL